MPHPIIRLATQKDLDHLVNLEQENFSTDVLSRHHFRYLLKRNSAEIYVAIHQKKLVGCAIMLFRKNSFTARIYSLVVSKQHRRLGIAQALQKKIEKNALRRHCDTIILEVRKDNTPAIQFYQKHHYKIFGKYIKFYEDQTDALRMKKSLTEIA